jgi:hypothetical protein
MNEVRLHTSVDTGRDSFWDEMRVKNNIITCSEGLTGGHVPARGRCMVHPEPSQGAVLRHERCALVAHSGAGAQRELLQACEAA